MLGPFDYVLWVAAVLADVAVIAFALYRKSFLRYLPLSIYVLAGLFVEVGRYACLHKFGLQSPVYFYYYYYSDAMIGILMYLVIIHLYQHVFSEMGVGKLIRIAAGFLLGLTAVFSYLVVHHNQDHLTARFVLEFEQNLNFVGVVLIYLLWGAVLKLRETRTRLIQLVLALGAYFSAIAGLYALWNLFPSLDEHTLRLIPPVMGTLLPLAWAYTLATVPEDSRLVPAAIAARAAR